MSLLIMPLSQFMKKMSSNASKINNIFERNPITANSVTGFITFAAGDVVSRGLLNKNNNNNDDDINSNNDNNNIIINNNNTRSFLTGVLGAFMNGVILTGWYVNLDRIFGHSMNDKKQIFIKCLCDQFIYSPLAIVVFFGHSSFFNAWNKTNHYNQIHNNHGDDNNNNKNSEDIYRNQAHNKDLKVSACSMIENNHNSNTYDNRFMQYATIDFNAKMKDKFVEAYLADCCFWPILNWLNFRYLPLHFRPSFVAVCQFFWQVILSTINNSEKESFLENGSNSNENI